MNHVPVYLKGSSDGSHTSASELPLSSVFRARDISNNTVERNPVGNDRVRGCFNIALVRRSIGHGRDAGVNEHGRAQRRPHTIAQWSYPSGPLSVTVGRSGSPMLGALASSAGRVRR
jgi:hypothetical protein